MSEESFRKVKAYLQELKLPPTTEDTQEELFIVEDEESGIKNLIIDCEDPILVLEQVILPVPPRPEKLFKRLLQINRTLVHGAFVLDEEAKMVLFRDTLQLTNLDLNELEGSINALSLALAENAAELLSLCRE
ncbi:MAG: YbjN domain-containing protein [Candidatus Tectomicrobia bacterium]|uniref:YbjN domain-containing protein n=1 Tax=Tectimicrobiota bacterium TaxID=2528274 RepID=A0A932FWK7_UNCTE|nr:YbjN domain-containing protein [Candidatus Tectomicrobia bacterium]